MEKISINNGEMRYQIESIMPVSEHVLQVIFADEVPEQYGDIQVYTAGGILCARLPGYGTVYGQEGQTVYLSDDGSVYQPPVEPEPVIPSEPYIPTPEGLLASAQAAKRAEVSADCEAIIYKGVSVTLTGGNTEHFSLTEHDQLNLFGKQARINL